MTIELYTPHSAQIPVHTACQDFTKNAPFFIFCSAGRQSGKSLASLNQMSRWLLENKETRGVWISPTESQAVKAFREMGTALSKAGLVKTKRSSAGALELVLINKSTCQFKSASAGDGLRGNTFEWFCIDEASFIKEDTWSNIIIPMATTRGRKVLVTSTPRGASNWFAQWFNRGTTDELTQKNRVKSFRYTSLDNPHSNKELIQLFKESLTPAQYQQEMEARFIDGANPFDGSSFCFSQDIHPLTAPEIGRKYYAGVDVAMSSDFTVCSIIDDTGKLVYMDRFNNIPAPAIRERLIKAFRKFNVKTTIIESNNQGSYLISELKSQGIRNIQEFLTTNTSKAELVDGLISAFANKQISIPSEFKILRDELDAFSLSYTSTGKAKYEASFGKDDCVMSFCFALRCKNQYQYISARPSFYIG